MHGQANIKLALEAFAAHDAYDNNSSLSVPASLLSELRLLETHWKIFKNVGCCIKFFQPFSIFFKPQRISDTLRKLVHFMITH